MHIFKIMFISKKLNPLDSIRRLLFYVFETSQQQRLEVQRKELFAEIKSAFFTKTE